MNRREMLSARAAEAKRGSSSEQGIDRRTFLSGSARVLAGCRLPGGIAGLLGGCASLPYAEHELLDQRIVVRTGAFGGGDAVLVEVPARLARPLSLQRIAEQEYLALSTECTHRGCQVELYADRFVCPCHGSEFSRDGAVRHGPADRDLQSFPVEVDGDRILIALPESGARRP